MFLLKIQEIKIRKTILKPANSAGQSATLSEEAEYMKALQIVDLLTEDGDCLPPHMLLGLEVIIVVFNAVGTALFNIQYFIVQCAMHL